MYSRGSDIWANIATSNTQQPWTWTTQIRNFELILFLFHADTCNKIIKRLYIETLRYNYTFWNKITISITVCFVGSNVFTVSKVKLLDIWEVIALMYTKCWQYLNLLSRAITDYTKRLEKKFVSRILFS